MARRREAATVAVMAAGFGLVGIDRFLITTMFPTIARDLHLNYADIGAITGALAIAWGCAALFMGNLSDRIGRRRVLIGSLILFSLLIGASGLATALGGLILVRIVMGIADGAYTPASITATLEASPPERHGLNIGIQQMMLPLCGLGLGPLAVGALLHVINWRYIFLIFVLPGLAVAYAVSRTVADAPADADSHGAAGPTGGGLDAAAGAVTAGLTAVAGSPISTHASTHAPAGAVVPGSAHSSATNSARGFIHDWRAALSERNIRLAAGMMLCWLTCLMSTSAFLPNYLTDYLKLPLGQMSSVMSAIGLGSTVGTLLWPWLSDRLGRRPIMILCTLGALGSLAWLNHAGAGVLSLFLPLFCVHFFNNALITLTVGPLCAESVPVGLAATASGLVIAIAEFFGGGLAPWLVGHAAQQFGIENFLILPIAAMAVGVILSASIRETRTALNPAASRA